MSATDAEVAAPTVEDEAASRRLAEVFELYELAEAIMRQNLRRRHPDADESDIESGLDAWRRERPGAPYGDASGPGFRRRR